MYKVRVSKDTISEKVNIQLFASHDEWDPEILKGLANLMRKHGILKLHLPKGKSYFEVTHFPVDYLRVFLRDLESLGFSIELYAV